MKHYYVVEPGKIGCLEEPVPEPGPGEVLVRVTHTSISPGSNVYIFQTGSYTGEWEGTPRECIYMGAGVVATLGEGVTGLSVGDAVVVGGLGHQEFAVAAQSRVHRLPAGVGPAEASLSYLAGWAVSALHLGRYSAAENVAVVGLGLVGASAALVADMMGARVVGIDVASERLDFAQRLGLSAVVNGRAENANEMVAEFAGPRGIDLILETSGVWSGFEQAFAIARDYTRIALMGLYRRLPSAEQAIRMHETLYGFPSKLHYKKIDIVGCGYDPESALPGAQLTFTREGNFAYLLKQAGRGKIDLSKLVTDHFEPHEVESVLARFAGGDRSMIGAVFHWESGAGDD